MRAFSERCCAQTSPELPTSYTFWSKGRLLGHSTLDFYPVSPTSRAGWFEPTDDGEQLMPVLTCLGPFHAEITRETAKRCLPGGELLDPRLCGDIARRALHYKLSEEAGAAVEELQLELRGPHGRTIPTASIGVSDTEYLLALPPLDDDLRPSDTDDTDATEPPDEFSAGLIELGLDDESFTADAELLEAEFAEAAGESWDYPVLPRYQIFVHLRDPADVPVSERWRRETTLPDPARGDSGFDDWFESRSRDVD